MILSFCITFVEEIYMHQAICTTKVFEWMQNAFKEQAHNLHVHTYIAIVEMGKSIL